VFAFWFDGGITKAADRGAQTFDRFVSDPERFRQSVFQDFSFGIERLQGRWRNFHVSQLRKNQSKPLQNVPGA
jgi:hypothetical protein